MKRLTLVWSRRDTEALAAAMAAHPATWHQQHRDLAPVIDLDERRGGAS